MRRMGLRKRRNSNETGRRVILLYHSAKWLYHNGEKLLGCQDTSVLVIR